MNKKLKYLSVIPLYGTCILFIYLFVLTLKDRISKKRFFKSFLVCAVISAICWYMVYMIVYIVSKQLIPFDFVAIGPVITMIVGGYIINAIAFKYVDIKWYYLHYNDPRDGLSFFEINKKKIILVAFFLAAVITIIGVAAIFAFELI